MTSLAQTKTGLKKYSEAEALLKEATAALGKTVIGYVSRPDSVKQRVEQLHGEISREAQTDQWRDRNGNLIEDFGHAVNLMLAESCTSIVVGSLEDALARLAECPLESSR